MASIHVDEKTVQQLTALAASCGMTLEGYLRSIATQNQPNSRPLSAEEFDSEVDALSIDGPTLPANFSRADIYADHD